MFETDRNTVDPGTNTNIRTTLLSAEHRPNVQVARAVRCGVRMATARAY